MRLSETLVPKLEGRIAVLPKDSTTQRSKCHWRGATLLAKCGPFILGLNEASKLFSELCGELLIEDLTFRDSMAGASIDVTAQGRADARD
jgi:hypothetical protein